VIGLGLLCAAPRQLQPHLGTGAEQASDLLEARRVIGEGTRCRRERAGGEF
jgi:hypothetical protein